MAFTTDQVIQAARDILGVVDDKALAERNVPDQAVRPGLRPAIRELNRVTRSSGRKEAAFNTVANQQDYLLTSICSGGVDDVARLDGKVLRESAHVPDDILSPGAVDPRTGLPLRGAGGTAIPMGYQGAAADVIVQQERWRHDDDFDEEIVTLGGVRYLRLFPTPEVVERAVMIYVTSGASIDTLPDTAQTAMEYAAVVALCDAMINRVNSQMPVFAGTNFGGDGGGGSGPASAERVKVMRAQRDRYEQLYLQELAQLRGAT
jgi:hypothetical protein